MFKKIITILLAIFLCLSAVGCRNDKPEGFSDNESELQSSNQSSANSEIEDTNSDSDDSGMNSDSDYNGINSGLEDFGESAIEYSKLIFKNNKKLTDCYTGTSAIYFNFTYIPDKTFTDEPYTEEEINREKKVFSESGVKLTRTFFYPEWAWDYDENCWDFDSEQMKGFYEYCDLLKENDADIVISLRGPDYGEKGYVASKTPFYLQTGTGDLKVNGPYYGKFWVEFVKEVIIKREYSNIKYFMVTTEPNNSEEFRYNKERFNQHLDSAKYVSEALSEAGLRDYIDIIGPNTTGAYELEDGYNSSIQWLKWTVEEYDDYIDIYAAHRYTHVYDTIGRYYNEHYEWAKAMIEVVKSTGKPFWCDETNAELGFTNYSVEEVDAFKRSGVSGLHWASTQVAAMNAGVSSSFMWALIDNRFYGANNGEYYGAQNCGVVPYFRVSNYINPQYYAMQLLSKAGSGSVYMYETEEDGVYATMVDNGDGNYSLIVINNNIYDVNLNYTFEKSIGNKTFTRYLYDTYNIEGSSLYRPIESDGKFLNKKTGFKDTLKGMTFAVYTTKG